MAKTAQITVRVAAELKAALERAAKAEDRSVAYVVERILREHFERQAYAAEASSRPRKR